MLFTAINTRLASALTGVALAAAVAAPAAPARPLSTAPAAQNVGSPDARDANNHYHPQLGEVVGSPDARDANNHYDPQLPATRRTVVDVSAPASSGFDWGSAAIGAAAGTGLLIVLLASGKSVAVVSRRIRVAR